MSFSSRTKDELCRLPYGRLCCARAEVYGALLFGHVFRADEIRVVTKSAAVLSRLPHLLEHVFAFAFDNAPAGNVPAGNAPAGNAPSGIASDTRQVLSLSSPDKLRACYEAFGYDASSSVALHLNNAVLDIECCPASFLRGAFLTGGSVIDPEKTYHMEISTPHLSLGREVYALMREVNLTPKTSSRAGHTVLYLKASEQIEDFLTMIGAPGAALRLMEAKVEKNLRNCVNRKVNCETANLSKTVAAAMRQTEAIERLRGGALWNSLSPALRETAELRLLHPEEPLGELCARFAPPIGRSGLNHRLRRLMEIANTDNAPPAL